MNDECMAHTFLLYLRSCLGIDPPWTFGALAAAIARVVGAQILLRFHAGLAGTRLDACCYTQDRSAYVVFCRRDLPPEQALRMQVEVLGRILLGQVSPGRPSCYSLCRGTPFADAVLAANRTPQLLVRALSGWTLGAMDEGQASPTEW